MRLVVITDPEADLSAVVDLDRYQSIGPAMPGAAGGQQLATFLASLTYDMDGASGDLLQSMFMQHMEQTGQLGDTAAPQGPGAPESTPPAGSDTEAPLALREAQGASGGPPAPAPADTDPTATGGPTPSGPAAGTSAENATASDGAGAPGPTATETRPLGEAPPAPTPAPPTRTEPCSNCHGTGQTTSSDPAQTAPVACPDCFGTGQVQVPA